MKKKKTIQLDFQKIILIVLTATLVISLGINILLMESSGLASTSTRTDSSEVLDAQAIYNEIAPTGKPAIYGDELGISYDNIDQGLSILANLERTISFDGLTPAQKSRYIEIATTPNTACEYCCGIGDNGFGTSDGKIACGCSHNLAFSGLTKYMLQNHEEVSDKQIIDEIQNWKILFFPKESVASELKTRGISPTAAGLPDMVGGC